jgi:hypothetical protein
MSDRAPTSILLRSASQAFSQPVFLIAGLVLLAAALTLNGAVQIMKLHFRKEPVELRHALDTIPQQLGPWLQISKDGPLDKELQDQLGTEKYIFRDYVDTRQISAGELEQFKKEITVGNALPHRIRLQEEKPTAVITAAVTYYTGLVDTVAHIPDRCYVADGFEPIEKTFPVWDVSPPAKLGSFANSVPRQLTVSFINFEDQTATHTTAPVNVAYFFQCNGTYEYDPLDGVRLRLQDLSQRHGYYAKIELKTNVSDTSAAKATMNDFLRYALPEIERCLPDWEQVKRSEMAAGDATRR